MIPIVVDPVTRKKFKTSYLLRILPDIGFLVFNECNRKSDKYDAVLTGSFNNNFKALIYELYFRMAFKFNQA